MTRLAFIMVLLAAVFPARAQYIPMWHFSAMDVASYRSLEMQERVAYVSGLLDGIFVAGWLQVGPPGREPAGDLNQVVNCITTLQHPQVERIISRYLSQNRVSDQDLMHSVARNALTIEAILEENPQAPTGGCELDAPN